MEADLCFSTVFKFSIFTLYFKSTCWSSFTFDFTVIMHFVDYFVMFIMYIDLHCPVCTVETKIGSMSCLIYFRVFMACFDKE